ncbi:hypothetical protein CVT26_014388 [Gymnopilus dilepis]|uniref:Uncharacterized protein n=1 Tax=Gymnopilus dilepis TaxID=231916 RepID=A0A409Y810_9AGAR|nr:hypothetical protein CVT26_014388 [Gymnopilus dilepis]
MSTFDSQWCKKQDAKEALRRGEAITKYLHEKIAALESPSPSRQIQPTAVIASASMPSSPSNPSTPTPPATRAALKPSTSQPMAMWTPNLSRDALSAPSGFVLSDGRPAPRLRWTPNPRWLPFSSPATEAAAVDEGDNTESQPAPSHDEAEAELELAGRILLRAEENVIDARLRYTRAYIQFKKLREV